MFPRILLGALLALAVPAVALAKPPMETNQLVDGDGVPLGTAANPLAVTGGGGGGGATGSVTAAGTNGSQAQAVQGINGGVPLTITGSFLLDTTFTGRINTLGQKAMAGSTPVVLPSDQVVSISATALPLPAGAATAAKQPAIGTAGSPAADVVSVQGIAGGTPQPIGGAVAAGTADSGNPVKVGGVYQTTPTTLSAGQRGDLFAGQYGQAMASLIDTGTNLPVRASGGSSDGQSTSFGGLVTNARGFVFSGAGWDRSMSGPAASNGTGLGTMATVLAPVSGAVGIAPVTTTTSGVVGKASAGNLYGFGGTMGATGGFLALLNATAVPAAGATIAPVECVPVAANASYRTRQDIPDRYTTGIVLLSTSSCTTYTAVTPVVMQVMDQ